MVKATLAILALALAQVAVADKWSDLKTQTYLDKKKRHRNLEEAKMDSSGTPKKKKAEYEKSLEKKKKYEPTTENYLKDERWQLCQSVDEADVKNTLLKFGLVSHLFDDAQKFRKSMKALQDLIPRSNKKKKKSKSGMKMEKEMIREKGGAAVKLSQSNWVGRALSTYLPTQAGYEGIPLEMQKEDTNTIWGSRPDRRKRDTLLKGSGSLRGRRKGTLKVPGQVPPCHGWKYLKALDVLDDNDNVDAEVLAESVSDMLNTEFSKSVSDILETCGERLAAGGSQLCPPPEDPVEGEERCQSQCLVNEECQYRELCCKASCGGFRCVSTAPPGKANPCQAADQYMQCVYQMIDNQLCSPEH